ncbi:MAG: very short patch repair endonuclease [Mucilaginibacter sp.]
MTQKVTKIYLRDGRAPIPSKESTSKVMSANKGKNTKPELALRKALWSAGFKGYRINWKQLPGRPDIAYPRKKLAIFINGCFWHRCSICKPNFPKSNVEFWTGKFSKNLNRDQRKEKDLNNLGWKVLTVWECEIKANIGSVVEKMKNLILNN